MSDTFILCPKCGEELETINIREWVCPNCFRVFDKITDRRKVKTVTTEYFNDKGEEDEAKSKEISGKS